MNANGCNYENCIFGITAIRETSCYETVALGTVKDTCVFSNIWKIHFQNQKGTCIFLNVCKRVCSLDTLIPTTSPSLKRKTSENDQSKQLTAAQMLWHFEVCQSNGFEENSEKPSATPLRS